MKRDTVSTDKWFYNGTIKKIVKTRDSITEICGGKK